MHWIGTAIAIVLGIAFVGVLGAGLFTLGGLLGGGLAGWLGGDSNKDIGIEKRKAKFTYGCALGLASIPILAAAMACLNTGQVDIPFVLLIGIPYLIGVGIPWVYTHRNFKEIKQ